MDVKETPFMLIARVKVKPGEVENYLKIYEMLLTDKIFLKKFWDGINDTSGEVYPLWSITMGFVKNDKLFFPVEGR